MSGISSIGGGQNSSMQRTQHRKRKGPPPEVRQKIQEFMQDGKIDSSERAQLQEMKRNRKQHRSHQSQQTQQTQQTQSTEYVNPMDKLQEIFSDGQVSTGEKKELHQMMQNMMQQMSQFNSMGSGMGMFTGF